MKLTNHITLLLITFLFIASSYSQSTSDQIKSIRKEFQTINSDTTLKKITLDGEDFLEHAPDGGAELSGYYKNGQIKKIYQWVGLSHGNEITEYYFKDGQLTFAYQKFISFSYNEKKGEMDYNKIKTTFEGRYYYNHKKLINSIFSGHNRSGENSSGTAKRLLSEAEDDVKVLGKKISK